MTRIGTFGCLLLGGALVFLALPAQADPVPHDVEAMINAAAATGDPVALKTVVDLAKKTNPASAKEIDAQVASLAAAAEKARVAKLAHETLIEEIHGQGSIGLTNTTGNSHTTAFAVGLNLTKETLRWKHTLDLEADYNKSAGVVTDEKYLANYEGNYKFSQRFYALVDVGWARDTFAGYDDRILGALGLGYKLIDTPKVQVSLEAGPSVRYTEYISVLGAPAYNQTDAGGRAAGNLTWNITPTTAFTQDIKTFLGGGGETIISTTALTTKVIGALSARLSFLLDYNSEPPPGIQDTDTTTRLSLVYGF